MAALGALALGGLGCTSGAAGGVSAGEREGGEGAGREAVARVAGCEPLAGPDSTAVRTRFDLPFAAPQGDTLRLDLAVPARPGPHPIVVLLHGGGWEGGHRSAMRDEMRLLAGRGYAAATASYRLTRAGRDVFPAAVRDARCAVRWLRAHADSLDLDPARVGALGFSAGAHLASMLGVAAAEGALDGPGCLPGADASPAVQAVVSVAGPQDLRVRGPYTREQARLVTNFLGVFPGDAPELARLASPIAHVGRGSAPFLLVHGTRDDLVPVEHARLMRAALHEAGVPATTLELRGVGHAFPALDARDRPEVGCTVLAFFERWLRPR